MSEPMDTLAALLEDYVCEQAPRLDAEYGWKIPDRRPECDFVRGNDSLASANRRLRRSLSDAWQAGIDARPGIERWYVSAWGGIHRNKPETLTNYARCSEVEIIARGNHGIASWSKILSIRSPDTYAIYDARVAAALNALQICNRLPAPIKFPNVPSRNTLIKTFQKKDRDFTQLATLAEEAPYQIYLQILKQVAKRTKIESIDFVEMVLFANAERLVRQANQTAPAGLT